MNVSLVGLYKYNTHSSLRKMSFSFLFAFYQFLSWGKLNNGLTLVKHRFCSDTNSYNQWCLKQMPWLCIKCDICELQFCNQQWFLSLYKSQLLQDGLFYSLSKLVYDLVFVIFWMFIWLLFVYWEVIHFANFDKVLSYFAMYCFNVSAKF